MLKLERRKDSKRSTHQKEVFLSICLGAGPIEAAPAANGQNHGIDGIEPLGNVPFKSIVNYHPTQSAIQKMQSLRDECTHVDKGALKIVFLVIFF